MPIHRLDALPPRARDLARRIDQEAGNRSGSLEMVEVDRFEKVHGPSADSEFLRGELRKFTPAGGAGPRLDIARLSGPLREQAEWANRAYGPGDGQLTLGQVMAYEADYAEEDWRHAAVFQPLRAVLERDGLPALQGPWRAHPAGGSSTPIVPCVVVVMDGGVDVAHDGLRNQVHTNPDEVPANGVDDDRNGYVDDVHGIDAASGTGEVSPLGRHGTHVAGIVVGPSMYEENGQLPNGVARNFAEVLPIRMPSMSTDEFVRAVDYVVAQKARGVNIRVVNCSWGGPGTAAELAVFNQAIQKLADADIVLVAATDNRPRDMNGVVEVLTSSGLPNVIVVGNEEEQGSTLKSAWGDKSVNIATDGTRIVSTVPGNFYASMTGSSMATPRVAAFAARLAAEHPTLTAIELRQRVLQEWHKNPNLAGLVENQRELGALPDPPPTAAGASAALVQQYLDDGALPQSRAGRVIDSGEAQALVAALQRAPAAEQPALKATLRTALLGASSRHQLDPRARQVLEAALQ